MASAMAHPAGDAFCRGTRVAFLKRNDPEATAVPAFNLL